MDKEEEAGAFFMSPKLVKIFLLEEREKGTTEKQRGERRWGGCEARATDRLAFHPSRVLRCSAVQWRCRILTMHKSASAVTNFCTVLSPGRSRELRYAKHSRWSASCSKRHKDNYDPDPDR